MKQDCSTTDVSQVNPDILTSYSYILRYRVLLRIGKLECTEVNTVTLTSSSTNIKVYDNVVSCSVSGAENERISTISIRYWITYGVAHGNGITGHNVITGSTNYPVIAVTANYPVMTVATH